MADDYSKLVAAQGGLCLICGAHHPDDQEEAWPVVTDPKEPDKCWGVLCSACYLGLESFRYNLGWLDNAAHYLWHKTKAYRRP